MTDLGERDRALLELAREAHDPTDEDRVRVRGALAARLGAAAGLGVAAASAGMTAKAGVVGSGAAAGTGATLTAKLIGTAIVIATAVGGGAAVRHARHAPIAADTSPAAHVAAPAARLAAPEPPTVTTPAELASPTGAKVDSDSTEHREDDARPTAPRERLTDGTHVQAPRPRPGVPGKPSSRQAHAPEPAPAETPAPDVGTAARAAEHQAEGVAGTTERPFSDLTNEARLMRDGVAALRAGQPVRALALFDAHAIFFANGALAIERAAERVLALAALGREQEARAAARQFLSAHPKSPLAARLRRRFPALDVPPDGSTAK